MQFTSSSRHADGNRHLSSSYFTVRRTIALEQLKENGWREFLKKFPGVNEPNDANHLDLIISHVTQAEWYKREKI